MSIATQVDINNVIEACAKVQEYAEI
jgi:hypothetical protein